ncbi:MAG: hypothetical protein B6242_05225 [Anaerolineaceae bacterium 4572_78]|nr:MAG: hypothetical protein B6242_05225 [Anaerolineaceae bacterium 4572_78]
MTARTKPINPRRRRTTIGYLANVFAAGFVGGVAVSILVVFYQIAFPLLRFFLIPSALIIIWIVTGIGAAMVSGEHVRTSQEGGRVGILAGIVSGTLSGIVSLIIAALGITFVGIGEGFQQQFSETQLEFFVQMGISSELLILIGSVLTSLFVCGFGSMFISIMLSGFGGWLYPKIGR